MESSELLAYIIKVSRKMVLIRIPDVLYACIIDEVMELVGAEYGYLVVIDQFGQIEYKASRQSTGDSPAEYPLEEDGISRSILNVVIQTRDPIVLGNAILDPRFADANSVVEYQLRSVMCVPLIAQERVIGAIYVENRSMQARFSEGDADPLSLLANQAAVSIKNAQLHESMEERVKARTAELEILNQKLVETKKGVDLANELLENRVMERTLRLEQEIKRREVQEAEKEQLFMTMMQQSEQLRHLTQLFLQNQDRQQGLSLTISERIKEKHRLLQSTLELLEEMVHHQGCDSPEATVMINHIQQAESILNSLHEQTETITTTLDQVTNESRDFGRNPLINLSAREREVLNYFVLGKSRSEIAELLFITPGTVSTYRKRIYQKLDITDHAGLMQLAIDNNLIG